MCVCEATCSSSSFSPRRGRRAPPAARRLPIVFLPILSLPSSVGLPLTAAGVRRRRLRLLLLPGRVPAGSELRPAARPGPVTAPEAAWGEVEARRQEGEQEGRFGADAACRR